MVFSLQSVLPPVYAGTVDHLTQTEIKKQLGQKAAGMIKDGMVVGLGSGTTATYFIDGLVERCQEGLNIQVVSSSAKSLKIAHDGGIPTLDASQVTEIDLTIDGADEVNPGNQMIKGGGGALTREKIVATMSRQTIIVVDESKLVDQLGQFGLPIEILTFGSQATIGHLNTLGYRGKVRTQEDGSAYMTDNGNFIYDLDDSHRFLNPQMDHQKIINIPGVVETGLFFDLPVEVLVGYANGNVQYREEPSGH